MADTDFLVKKGNVWMVAVTVPKALREAVGKLEGKPEGVTRLKASLKTSSLAEANRLKWPFITAFKARIDEAKLKQENPTAAALRDATEWRPVLATASRETVDEGERTEHVPYEELLSEVKRLASMLADENPDLGSRYLKVATGEGTILKTYIEPFIAEVVASGQTKVQHKSTINLYITWAGEFTTVEECDRVKAGEYVTHLLTASGLARATIKRHLSSLSQYWLWLESKGHARNNPWLGHRLGKKKNGKARTGLPDDKILKVLEGSYSTKKFDQLIKDLVRLALLHGARLEELCALKKADVHKREDGYWFVIGEAKTESGVRELPVHPKAMPIIERRMKGKGDEFLFEGLTPGGPDDKRSWYVSKAYGRFRAQIGVSAKYEDFHALRHTYIAMMEGLEVAESTVKLLVGHKRTSMTYGLYSKGQRVNLRKAMETMDFGKQIMASI